MASKTTVSDEEIQLRKRARRRLVGAVALVVLVVAAVPMVLDGEPKGRNEQIDVRIPPVPAVPDSTPAPGAAAPAGAEAAGSAPGTATSATGPLTPAPAPALLERTPEPQPAPPQSVPPPPSPGASPAPSAPAAPRTSATSKEAYAVQLIATASPAKARELRQKLERQKFPVYTEKTPDGGKIRVRVGPYPTRDAAEQARQRLARLDYDPGKVVRRGD